MKGSVRKRGATWSYYFDLGKVDGKRKRKEKKGFRTKKEAEAALANLCGWNTDNARSTISKIESGTNDVPTSKLKIIAEKLGVSVCDLMDCSNIQEQSESVELVKQVYDEETQFVISSFIKLDAVDRIKVIERINTLLDDEKYSVKKESSGSQTA